jgi:hypothetical protein
MRVIRTASPPPADALGALALYSGMDVLSLFEINAALDEELSPTKRLTYEFEMDLQSALIEMSFQGCPVDIPRRQALVTEFEQERSRVAQHLHSFCKAIGFYEYYLQIAIARYSHAIAIDPRELPTSWSEWLALPIQTRRAWKLLDPAALAEFQKALKEFAQPFNANSPPQKLRLFYHFFGHDENTISQELYPDILCCHNKTRGITEYKSRGANGEFSPSTDRDALERILKLAGDDLRDAAYWAQPFVQGCLAIADLTKALGFLTCRLEQGVFRSSFGAVTETGRLNSKANAQGFGSNAQNVAPRLRVVLTCPLGTKMGTPDYEQIESRNVGAICFTLFGATAYLNATESGDLHSLACSMVWDDLAWPADFTLDWLAAHGPFPGDMIQAAKQIAGAKFYRGKSRRDVSKTLGHGTNYCGKPVHMARQSHIDLGLVQHYQDVYLQAFPEIKKWHLNVMQQVQTKGEITTLFGRTRQFFGRPSDDATIREAVAFAPQSMAADYTNRALLAMHRASLRGELPIELFLQKHDELGFRYAEPVESAVLPKVQELMTQHVMLRSPAGLAREWCVPVEMQSGWNLGKASAANPDGIKVWHGQDSRTRTENPFNAMRIVL